MQNVKSGRSAGFAFISRAEPAGKVRFHRSLLEKILLYVCGTIAVLYTLNLIAYSVSGYLQQRMSEAHGLTPKHILPIAALLISGFGLLAARGWYGPFSRLAKATAIKEALEKYAQS